MDTQRPLPDITPQPLYEADFYAWTQHQVKLLQDGRWSELDIPNLVEELETLGRQERSELENRLGVLIGHLLRWTFQPEHRSNSWRATIREQRRKIQRLLRRNPSLKPYVSEAFTEAYSDAIDLFVQDTNLEFDTLPDQCPFTLEQTLDEAYWPDNLESPETQGNNHS